MNVKITKKRTEWYSLACATLLILVSIFTLRPLVYVAFLIEIYRLACYGTKTLLMDLAFLFSFANVFRASGGVSFAAYLSLIFDFYYMFNKKIPINNSLLLLVVLMVYMLLRMGSAFSAMVLIVSSLMLLYFLTKDIKSQDALKIIKMFCLGVLISSIFAYVFKDFSALKEYTHTSTISKDSENIRFSGLLQDPNYYAVNLILAIVSLMILLYYKHITLSVFTIGAGAFFLFGVFTYSKSFFIEVVLLYCFGLFILFKKRKYDVFCILLLVGIGSLVAIFSGKIDLLNPLIKRFKEAEDINELTTGRFGLWIAYLNKTMETVSSALFGWGFGAEIGTVEQGSHNIFIEIMYYTGWIGLLLFMMFIGSMILRVSRRMPQKQKLLHYLPFIAMFVCYFALQGMFSINFYYQIFLSLCAMKIVSNDILKKENDSCEK